MTELEALPFAKPSRRIISKRTVDAYAKGHRQCEIKGCATRQSWLETHHIVSRKMGGSDVNENLLRLCPEMHREWHTVGGHEFFRRYRDRLTDEARSKVMTALRLEE